MKKIVKAGRRVDAMNKLQRVARRVLEEIGFPDNERLLDASTPMSDRNNSHTFLIFLDGVMSPIDFNFHEVENETDEQLRVAVMSGMEKSLLELKALIDERLEKLKEIR